MSADPVATAAVRRFVDAFNAEDLDALIATLSPDVEIQSSRGLIEGREEVRRWATRKPSGDLHQRLVLDDVSEHGAHAVASVRRQWTWPDGEVADEQELFYVATVRDGLICRWQPFDDHDEALRAAGVRTNA
jgi:nuclear transport factor 2 (NTF2) superfamily protein